MVNNFKITGVKEICSKLNEHFRSNPSRIWNHVNPCSVDYVYLWTCYPVTENEIVSCLGILNENGNFPEISRNFLIFRWEYVPSHVCELIIFYIVNGINPNEFKTASIIPLHKKKPQYAISNFWPVTVLDSLSKNFAGVVFTTLQSFFV